MSEEHEDYRPRSPDLSAFAPLPPPPPPTHLNRLPSFHATDSSFPPGYSFSPRNSYDASPYFSPRTAQPTTLYFGSQSPFPSPQAPRAPSLPTASFAQTQAQPQFFGSAPQLDQPQPRYRQPPAYNPTAPQSQPPAQSSQPQLPVQAPSYADMARTRQKKLADDHDAEYDPNNSAPARTSQLVKPEQSSFSATPSLPISTEVVHSIDVKTKFPVARIKRIMQADEDVGKVAQATPTAVSKALELFMITLVAKGADEARSQNSKRVTAQHLKAALMKDPQFDFLNEVCENVPDEGTKKGRAKSEAKSEDSDDMDLSGPKKKSKSKKRKAGTDDDSD